jgi:hypothetical protein
MIKYKTTTLSRYFASINTQYNPVFGFVNLTRDIGAPRGDPRGILGHRVVHHWHARHSS